MNDMKIRTKSNSRTVICYNVNTKYMLKRISGHNTIWYHNKRIIETDGKQPHVRVR